MCCVCCVSLIAMIATMNMKALQLQITCNVFNMFIKAESRNNFQERKLKYDHNSCKLTTSLSNMQLLPSILYHLVHYSALYSNVLYFTVTSAHVRMAASLSKMAKMVAFCLSSRMSFPAICTPLYTATHTSPNSPLPKLCPSSTSSLGNPHTEQRMEARRRKWGREGMVEGEEVEEGRKKREGEREGWEERGSEGKEMRRGRDGKEEGTAREDDEE